MPTDTRSQYRAPGLPLSIGRKVGNIPGAYESGTSGNKPGPTQSPARSPVTMVQTTPAGTKPAAPKAPNRPNQGGTMTRGGVVTMVPPSAAQNTDPNRAGSGGKITRNGVVTMVAPTPAKVAPAVASPVSPVTPAKPSPAAMKFLQDGVAPELSPVSAAPVSSPTTRAAQQTESANPLTGDTNSTPAGTSAPVNPGQAMGFNRAGAGVPRGQDAMPSATPEAAPVAPAQSTSQKVGASMQGTFDNLRGKTPGGTGLYKRNFSNPKSAGLYDGYVKRLFGDAMPA